MTLKLIDTPDEAVETLGAAMDRLRQLAYRIPPDEDGHGAVTWQEKYEQAVGLLAEVGSLLYTIHVFDGTPYKLGRERHHAPLPYMHVEAFADLLQRVEAAVGGNLMTAAMEARDRRRP